MQRSTGGAGSLRASWRLRQATKDAFANAAHQPTQATRPLLLLGRLAPLFFSYSAELSAANFSWDDDHVLKAAGGSDGASNSSTCTNAGHNGASAKIADRNIRSVIVAHMKNLEHADGWRGLNRALLHALLFAAWQRTRSIHVTAAPDDDLGIEANWRLSTGAYAFIVAALDWQDLAVYALRWLPGDRKACVLSAVELVKARPQLTAFFLCEFVSGFPLQPNSTASVADLADVGPTATHFPAVIADGKPAIGGVGSIHSAQLLQAGCLACSQLVSVTLQTDCLVGILQATAGFILTATAAMLADDHSHGSCEARHAVGIACNALTRLLGTWPATEDACAVGTNTAELGYETNRQIELRHQLQRVSGALKPLASCSLQPMLQLPQQQGAANAGVHDTVATRQLFQSCCSLRMQLARLGVQSPVERTALDLRHHVPSVVQPVPGASAAPQRIHHTIDWHLPDWQQALRTDVPFECASIDENVIIGNERNGCVDDSNSRRSSVSDSTVEECLMAEALVRAMPGRMLRYSTLQDETARREPSSSTTVAATDAAERWGARCGADASEQHVPTGHELQRHGWPPVVSDATPLSAAVLATTLLAMLWQLKDAQAMPCAETAAAMWRLTCCGFIAAAADISDAAQQQALLQMSHAPSLEGLMQALSDDTALNQQAAASLIAISNRMNLGDEDGPRIFGDRAAEVDALLQAVLPWAVLSPNVVLRRLLLDSALHPQQSDVLTAVLQALVHIHGEWSLSANAGWRLLLCLSDVFVGARNHLLNESSAADFLLAACKLTIPPSEGGRALLTWHSIVSQIVLPILSDSLADGSTAYSTSLSESAIEIPLMFALQLLVALLEKHATETFPGLVSPTEAAAQQVHAAGTAATGDTHQGMKSQQSLHVHQTEAQLVQYTSAKRRHSAWDSQHEARGPSYALQPECFRTPSRFCEAAQNPASANAVNPGPAVQSEDYAAMPASISPTGFFDNAEVYVAVYRHMDRPPAIHPVNAVAKRAAKLLHPVLAAQLQHATLEQRATTGKQLRAVLTQCSWRSRLSVSRTVILACRTAAGCKDNTSGQPQHDNSRPVSQPVSQPAGQSTVTRGVHIGDSDSQLQKAKHMAESCSGVKDAPWEKHARHLLRPQSLLGLTGHAATAVSDVTSVLLQCPPHQNSAPNSAASSTGVNVDLSSIQRHMAQQPAAVEAAAIDMMLLCATSRSAAATITACCRFLTVAGHVQDYPERPKGGVWECDSAAVSILLVAAPLEVLRSALLAACGALAATFTAAEFSCAAHVAVPALVGAALSRACRPPAVPASLSEWMSLIHAASMDLWCRSLELLETQAAVDCVLVHISGYCHQLTARASSSPANEPLPVVAMAAPVETGLDDAAIFQDSKCAEQAATPDPAAANKRQPHVLEGKNVAHLASCEATDAAAVQLAQRAFGELAAAADIAATRGIHFRRCQPLMMHLLAVMFSRQHSIGSGEMTSEPTSDASSKRERQVSCLRKWAREQILEGHPMHTALSFAVLKAAGDAQDAIYSIQ